MKKQLPKTPKPALVKIQEAKRLELRVIKTGIRAGRATREPREPRGR